MAITAQGVSARELDDSTLERELEHLHETRHDTFLNGSGDVSRVRRNPQCILAQRSHPRLRHLRQIDPLSPVSYSQLRR